jgi:two-component system, NtrC family, sensor histidine kinase HydH
MSMHPKKLQRGVVATIALTALLTLASAWTMADQLRDAGHQLIEGQGHSLVATAHSSLRRLHGRPEQEHLDAILAGLTPLGAAAVALYRPDGQLDLSAGEPTAPWPAERDGKALPLRQVDDARWQISAPLGPRPRHGPPHHGGPPRLGPPDGGPDGGPDGERASPTLLIEFSPTLAADLDESASWRVRVAIAIALLLAGLAALLGWLLGALQRAQLDSERAQHMARLGAMSATLAHEIKNPLASLKGHAQLLEATLEPGPHRDRAERVVTDAARLEDRVAELLDYVRAGQIHPADADLLTILQRAIEVIGLDVEVHTTGRHTRMQLDPARLQRVFENLLDNAMQAAPDAPAEVHVRFEPDAVRVEILDRGPGLAGVDTARLFEPFYTTRTRGTGLGLAIARAIIDAHGGAIAATERDGGGARLTITLPLRET